MMKNLGTRPRQDICTYNLSGPKKFILDIPNYPPLLVAILKMMDDHQCHLMLDLPTPSLRRMMFAVMGHNMTFC